MARVAIAGMLTDMDVGNAGVAGAFTCHDPRASPAKGVTFASSLATCGGGVHPCNRTTPMQIVSSFGVGRSEMEN